MKMICTENKDLVLHSWFEKNKPLVCKSRTRLQITLFLFKTFSKAGGTEPDFPDTEQFNTLSAKRASFISSSLSEVELIALACQFDAWDTKCQYITEKTPECGLTENDFALVKTLEQMYPNSMIQDCDIVAVGEKYFVFSKTGLALLTEQHYAVLSALAEQADLHNPVFAELDGDGTLCVE